MTITIRSVFTSFLLLLCFADAVGSPQQQQLVQPFGGLRVSSDQMLGGQVRLLRRRKRKDDRRRVGWPPGGCGCYNPQPRIQQIWVEEEADLAIVMQKRLEEGS